MVKSPKLRRNEPKKPVQNKSNGGGGILEYARNIVISAYDQRKLPFMSKLKNGFSFMNAFSIMKTILFSYQEGKSFVQITKDVVYECLKIFC